MHYALDTVSLVLKLLHVVLYYSQKETRTVIFAILDYLRW